MEQRRVTTRSRFRLGILLHSIVILGAMHALGVFNIRGTALVFIVLVAGQLADWYMYGKTRLEFQ